MRTGATRLEFEPTKAPAPISAQQRKEAGVDFKPEASKKPAV